MNNVSGVVDKKGDKFNGSLFVNGEWFNFKKGVDNSGVKVGDVVDITLGEWEFKGKKGVNITSFKVIETPKQETKTETVESSSAYKPRDFNSENRGKTRCNLVAASMPLVLTGTVGVDYLKKIVDELVEYIFDGK